MFQVLPQLFPCLCFSVAMYTLQFLFPGVVSMPVTWNQFVLVILTVHISILDCRISHAHEIMTTDANEDDIGGYLGLKLYHTK